MIKVDLRPFGTWLLVNVAAIAAGFGVGIPVGVVVAFALTRDSGDDPWESFGDALVAGFWGVLVGFAVTLLVLGRLTDRWLAPGRGGHMVLATVGAAAGSIGLAVLLLSAFDDGQGPEDVFVGWAIVPPALVAQWWAARLASLPVVGGTVLASLGVMVVGAVIL